MTSAPPLAVNVSGNAPDDDRQEADEPAEKDAECRRRPCRSPRCGDPDSPTPRRRRSAAGTGADEVHHVAAVDPGLERNGQFDPGSGELRQEDAARERRLGESPSVLPATRRLVTITSTASTGMSSRARSLTSGPTTSPLAACTSCRAAIATTSFSWMTRSRVASRMLSPLRTRRTKTRTPFGKASISAIVRPIQPGW